MGGSKADVGTYPYFGKCGKKLLGASFPTYPHGMPHRLRKFLVDLKRCGGSLIAPNVVLSAAHCDPYGTSLVGKNALVGAYERGQQESFGAVSVKIKESIPHPQYDTTTSNNDFLLLKLKSDVDIGSGLPSFP